MQIQHNNGVAFISFASLPDTRDVLHNDKVAFISFAALQDDKVAFVG
jgi:hypothetical protein